MTKLLDGLFRLPQAVENDGDVVRQFGVLRFALQLPEKRQRLIEVALAEMLIRLLPNGLCLFHHRRCLYALNRVAVFWRMLRL
ncbi:hypothetical protein NA655_02180 [Pseudomonas kuykendallii]|uniref:hypothetical protein n=1 Tax=Pseudomonas kuykendallii TaxID=1007099 RepID=UPI00158770B9|nr:hypothetical protein [Pseudomonas kuykendallii]MCQ4269824.1 hypothetical protein [Pseudomonas kuykendallii]